MSSRRAAESSMGINSSTSEAAREAIGQRWVARKVAASFSCMNTGWRFCGLVSEKSLSPSFR